MQVVNAAGVPLSAKQRGLIDAVRPLLARLRAEGYFLSNAILEHVLRLAGEA